MNAELVQSTLPDLAPADKARLGRLFFLSEDLTKLSEETKTDLLSLYQWHARADIQAYIRHHRSELNHQRTQAALDALESIVKTTDDPIEKRRAANAILRITGAAPEKAPKDQDQETPSSSVPRGHFLTTTPHKPALEEALELLAKLNQDQDEDDVDDDPPSTPNAPAPRPPAAAAQPPQSPLVFPHHIERPAPERSPHELSALILDALERPDTPNKGDGLLTLYSLTLPLTTHSQEEFAGKIGYIKSTLPAAIRHTNAQTSELIIDGDNAGQTITFTHEKHAPTTAFLLLIRAPIRTRDSADLPAKPGAPPPKAWQILSLERAGP